MHQLNVQKKLGQGDDTKKLSMKFQPEATSQFYSNIFPHLILCQHLKMFYFIYLFFANILASSYFLPTFENVLFYIFIVCQHFASSHFMPTFENVLFYFIAVLPSQMLMTYTHTAFIFRLRIIFIMSLYLHVMH